MRIFFIIHNNILNKNNSQHFFKFFIVINIRKTINKKILKNFIICFDEQQYNVIIAPRIVGL